MAIINETKKYLHMLVKILFFVLTLCVLKLIESFFEIKNMSVIYTGIYLFFSLFIIGRLFSTKKEKIMILLYLLTDTLVSIYLLEKKSYFYLKYFIFFVLLSSLMILIYYFFNKKEKKKEFLIFLIPFYLLFVKLTFVITYIYLHIDEFNISHLWFL